MALTNPTFRRQTAVLAVDAEEVVSCLMSGLPASYILVQADTAGAHEIVVNDAAFAADTTLVLSGTTPFEIDLVHLRNEVQIQQVTCKAKTLNTTFTVLGHR